APAPARPGPDPAAGTRAHRRDARREVDRRRRRDRRRAALGLVLAAAVVGGSGWALVTGRVPAEVTDRALALAPSSWTADDERVERVEPVGTVEPEGTTVGAAVTTPVTTGPTAPDPAPGVGAAGPQAAPAPTSSDLCVEYVRDGLAPGSPDYVTLVAAAGGADLTAWCTDRIGAVEGPESG
ncbi:hypothetical protein EPD83_015715, partial [Phycicoccus sp. CMS6Z-2]|nr:hypothetical protein [Phycicoccus flavus]